MTSKTLSRPAFVLLTLGCLLTCAPACSRSSVVPLTRSSAPPTVVDVAEPAAPRRADAGTTARADEGDVDGGADATAGTRRAAPREDTFVTPSGSDGWVKALPRAKTYLTLDLAAGAPSASLLEITWRIHPSRTLQRLPPDQDYAGNHPSKLELVLTRGAVVRRLPLGEHGGSPDSLGLTSCRRLGYTIAPGDTPDSDVTWAIPTLPNLVSTFMMETMQGSTDFMLLLGHDVLHVVHRFTHDGACPVTVEQGPLRTCADMTWQLFADVRITGEPRARETVVELDAARTATPFDCKHSYSGERLVEP
ncbi:MAG: hypothetical protein JWO86_8520 [Myxococcaceae bacterium]|nr:hypothetical protein [Myxococcaceae bacterium]